MIMCFEGFLTAVLQSHARKNGIAIDSLSYHYKVSNQWWCPSDASSDKTIDVNFASFQVIQVYSSVKHFSLLVYQSIE